MLKLNEILEIETKLLHDIQVKKIDQSINIPHISVYENNLSKTANSIEIFLRFFFDKEALLSQKLINFLQIPNPYRKKLFKKLQESQKFAPEDLNINNSLSSQYSKSNIPEESETSLAEPSEKHFCVFFLIEYIEYKRIDLDHYEYMFMLTSKSANMPKQWTISKRYNDFLKLEERLKKDLSTNIPKLPGKQLFHNEDVLHERCMKLESFLRILLNETKYLSEDLLNFIEFWSENSNPLKLFDIKQLGFPNIQGCYRNFEAKEFDSKISFENNETQFVLYLISIEELGKFRCKIGKRYTDFERLYQALIIRFNGDKGLPELPGKLDFLVKSQIKSRGERLMDFINKLFVMNEIEDCFEWRKFIGIEVKNLVNE